MVIPFAIHTKKAKETNERMSHQSNTTTLRGTVDEGDAGLVLDERVCELQSCPPSIFVLDTSSIVFKIGDLGLATCVNLDKSSILEHQTWEVVRTEFPKHSQSIDSTHQDIKPTR